MTQENKDFFKNAKFGDKFRDIEGKIWIYHYQSNSKTWTYHYLMREPTTYESEYFGNVEHHPYNSYVFMEGYGVPTNLKYYPINKIKESLSKGYLIIEKLEQ